MNLELNQLADAVAARLAGGATNNLSVGAGIPGVVLAPRARAALACQAVLIPVEYTVNAGRGQIRTTAYLEFDGAHANDLAALAEQLRECGFRVRGQFDRGDGGYRDDYRGNDGGGYGNRRGGYGR